MRNQFFSALLVFLIATPAGAGVVEDCNQSSDSARKVAGCGKLIGLVKGRERAIAFNLRAKGWSLQDKYDRAISDYTEALAIDPKFEDALFGRGQAYARSGQLDKALADLQEGLRLYPNKGEFYAVRGFVRRELRDFENALKDFDEGIRLSSRVAEIHVHRGLLLVDMGQYDRAIADYDQAILQNPRDNHAYSNRGEAWRLKGDLNRALEDQNKQISVAPEEESGYLRRGDTYRYIGQFERALSDYEKVLSKDADNSIALTGRGLTFEKMGRLGDARSDFLKSIRSTGQFLGVEVRAARETAAARLAALDSGTEQPAIKLPPAKATSATTIPTAAVSVTESTVPQKRQGRRIALVIGNSEYKNVPPLVNPRNDADAVAKSLRNIGFESVTLVNDATREKLIDALRMFANEAENSDWAMVYYAGHGIEIGGTNYLIPTDAKLAVDRDIEYEAIAVAQVLRAAASAKKIKLVMLDACRVNPFKPRKTDVPEVIAASEPGTGRAVAARSTVGRGFARIEVASGATLVVFAARDGQIALDGEGANSPFAIAVTQRIATPGVELNKIFRLVRDDVMEATAGRQEPYTYGSLPGNEDFYFVAK